MTAAATALHRTQGAVSQQIKRLEEMLGCSLFERDRRGIRLTDAGERLLGRAKRMLSLHDEIRADMARSIFTGSVRLGVPYDLVGNYLPPVLKAFAQAYPQVDVSLVCASSPELIQAYKAGEIDLAVAEEPAGASDVECLAIDLLVWVGARRGNAHRKRPIPLSVISDSCVFRPALVAALRAEGLEWRAVFENGNIEATCAMVRMDLAVTAWLASTVPPDLEILAEESGLPVLPSFAINLHVPASSDERGTRELVRYIREGFRRQSRHAAIAVAPGEA
jgi:DNA-binding transcriptional LysR family regulator